MTNRASEWLRAFVESGGYLPEWPKGADQRPEPSVPPHVHRWLPAGLIHSGTMVVQSCECGAVRTVKVPG